MVRILAIILFSVSVCYGQANRFAGFGSGGSTVGCSSANYLVDAQKFIDSSGIVNAIEISAIQALIKSLQDSCLWTKMASVYPFVGSTANSTKFNLKSPFTQDTSYRILWFGGMSYGSYGVKGNAVNAYGDTRFTQSKFQTDSGAIGLLVNNNIDQVSAVMGMINSSFRGWTVHPRISNTLYSNTGTDFTTATNTDSRGIYIVTGTSSLVSMTYKNDSLIIPTNAGTQTTESPSLNMYVCARSLNNSPQIYSSYELGFIFISKGGLNRRECKAMYDIISAFKTTLGR